MKFIIKHSLLFIYLKNLLNELKRILNSGKNPVTFKKKQQQRKDTFGCYLRDQRQIIYWFKMTKMLLVLSVLDQ